MKKETFMPIFGKKLRKLRERSGITQQELAQRIGKNGTKDSAIRRLERGEGNPTISTLLDLAKAFKVSVSELVDL